MNRRVNATPGAALHMLIAESTGRASADLIGFLCEAVALIRKDDRPGDADVLLDDDSV